MLQQIREDPRFDHICIVLLSVYGDIPTATEALQLGAFQFLTKPVKFECLKTTLSLGIAGKAPRAKRKAVSGIELETLIERMRRCFMMQPL